MHIDSTHRALLELCLRQATDEKLPAEVTLRLQWIQDFAVHGSVSGTCRRFGIARTTFYRWLRRFDPNNLLCLTDAPKLPRTDSHGLVESTGAYSSPLHIQNGSLAHQRFFPMVGIALSKFWYRFKTVVLTTSVLVNLLILLALLATAHWESSRADLFDQSSQHLAPPSIDSFDSGPLP
jgi:hypothetical protein